ncbi:MAG: type 4a pilus biogenesis protein PilO [Patescibacteria group bacterium]
MRNQPSKYFRYFTYVKPLVRLPIVRTYGTQIFTILTIIIFIFFAIKPTVETILILQKKLENSNQVLEKLHKKSESLSEGRQNYDNLDPSIKSKIQTAIPDYVELKSVVQALEGAAKINDASISALQIQPQVLETKLDSQIGILSEVGFTFNVEGSYPNLISILQDLSTSSRLISIDNLSITKAGEDQGLIMSISGKAWYLK